MNKQTADFLSEVARLHFSRSQSWQFGKGGELPKYAKSWQSYNFLEKLAGIRLEAGMVIAENKEGVESLRVRLPKLDNIVLHTSTKLNTPKLNYNQSSYIAVSTSPLLGGDYYGVAKGKDFGLVLRYGIKEGKWKKTGIAVRLKLDTPEGAFDYWEHGKDKEEITRNYTEKVGVIASKKLEWEARAYLQKNRERIQRAKRLIVRLCDKMVLQVEDAKRIGYCNAGIMDYCKSFGFKAELVVNDGNGKDLIIADAQFASALKATKDYRALRLIEIKAENLAIELIKRRDSEKNAKAS